MTDTNKILSEAEKARDEKCIPIAKAILNDMAIYMMPEDANVKVDFVPIVTKMLERTLAADTNLIMENPYIAQLLLGVFSSLNETVQSCTFLPIDDIRYGAISKKILDIVATSDITMGEVSKEQKAKDFAPIKERLNVLFVEEKLSLIDIKYIMDTIFESFNTVNSTFAVSVEKSVKAAEAKLLGLNDLDELGMKKLDDVLKEMK